MTDLLVLAWLSGAIWGFLSVVVFLTSIMLIFVILIQDSKDTGLTSAFGGAGGGNALLGARMQKELAKITGIIAFILCFSLVVMGFITAKTVNQSIGAGIAAPPPPESSLPAPGSPGMDGAEDGMDPLRPGGFGLPTPGGTTSPGGATPPAGATPPGGATLPGGATPPGKTTAPGGATPPGGASGAGSTTPAPGGAGSAGATPSRPPLNPLPSPIIPVPAPQGGSSPGPSDPKTSTGAPAPPSPGAPQKPPEEAPRG